MKNTEVNIGVIVGRFQVAYLTKGHRHLIDTAIKENDEVIIFIGDTVVKNTIMNPLVFGDRMLLFMNDKKINELVGSGKLIIEKIPDIGNVEIWNKKLDTLIKEKSRYQNTPKNVTIYGSRKSMVQTYDGEFNTAIVEEIPGVSGTESRSNMIYDMNAKFKPEYRIGKICAAYDRYPSGFPTIDVTVIHKGNILMGKRPNRDTFCFVGGFFDPTQDESLEDTAIRELYEETNIKIKNPRYITSFRVDGDYRYKQEIDKIITSFYIGEYESGKLQAADDLAEAHWIPLNEVFDSPTEFNVSPVHITLLYRLKTWLDDQATFKKYFII